MIFFHNRRYAGDLRTKAGDLVGGHKPPRRALGGAPGKLVGPTCLLCPTSFAYKFSKILKPKKGATKILFRRRKLLSLQDPIWGTFWCPAGGGIRIRRAFHQHHDLSDDA